MFFQVKYVVQPKNASKTKTVSKSLKYISVHLSLINLELV